MPHAPIRTATRIVIQWEPPAIRAPSTSSQDSQRVGARCELTGIPIGSGESRSDKRRIAVEILGMSASVTSSATSATTISNTVSPTGAPAMLPQMDMTMMGTIATTMEMRIGVVIQSTHTTVDEVNARNEFDACARAFIRGGICIRSVVYVAFQPSCPTHCSKRAGLSLLDHTNAATSRVQLVVDITSTAALGCPSSRRSRVNVYLRSRL